MAVRPILIHPDPRLTRKCAPVGNLDAETEKLMRDLADSMYDAPGVGLAAPQIGVMQRVFVMDCSEKEAPAELICLANPEIIASSDEENTHEEGCLSIPEIYGNVTRPAEVTVEFLNLKGEIERRDFGGLQATCAQHEIDHLNGRLFIDYLSPMRREMITTKMKKRKRAQYKARK